MSIMVSLKVSNKASINPLMEIIPWATLRVSNGFILLIDRYKATINFVLGDIGHPGCVMGGRKIFSLF